MIEDEIEVQLTYVEDVRNIWVSKVEDIAKVDQIVEKLSASPNLVKLPSIALGQLAMAKSEEDGSLGRVKVETVQEGGFGVRYIDYGNVEKKLGGEMYALPKEVEKIPPHLKKLSNQLRAAKKFGIHLKDVKACKTKFKCPLSNEEMKKMIGYEGNQDHDNNV